MCVPCSLTERYHSDSIIDFSLQLQLLRISTGLNEVLLPTPARELEYTWETQEDWGGLGRKQEEDWGRDASVGGHRGSTFTVFKEGPQWGEVNIAGLQKRQKSDIFPPMNQTLTCGVYEGCTVGSSPVLHAAANRALFCQRPHVYRPRNHCDISTLGFWGENESFSHDAWKSLVMWCGSMQHCHLLPRQAQQFSYTSPSLPVLSAVRRICARGGVPLVLCVVFYAA